MNKIILLAATLSCMNLSSIVKADSTMKTEFRGYVLIAGVRHDMPDPGHKISMPNSLSNYECGVTERLTSDDGEQYYHNIYCNETVSGVTIGASVSCMVNLSSSESKSFFIRSPGAKGIGVEVDLFLSCATRT
jgi:hypothetical protein